MQQARALALIFGAIVGGTVLMPPDFARAAAKFASNCADDTLDAAAKVSGVGTKAFTATTTVAGAATLSGKFAVAKVATKASGIVSAVTIGAEAGAAFGAFAWGISNRFWKALGKKDPTPAMPDPTTPTVLTPIDLAQVYALAGIDPTQVPSVSGLVPLAQTTLTLLNDTMTYDSELTAFTTAYTKFLEARLERDLGGPNAPFYAVLTEQHRAEVKTFAPLLESGADTLTLDGAAQDAAWANLQALYTSFVDSPLTFTAADATALQANYAAGGFPEREAAIMGLLGMSADDIAGLLGDFGALPPSAIAGNSFADQYAICQECEKKVVHSVLSDVPEPASGSIMLGALAALVVTLDLKRRRSA